MEEDLLSKPDFNSKPSLGGSNQTLYHNSKFKLELKMKKISTSDVPEIKDLYFMVKIQRISWALLSSACLFSYLDMAKY